MGTKPDHGHSEGAFEAFLKMNGHLTPKLMPEGGLLGPFWGAQERLTWRLTFFQPVPLQKLLFWASILAAPQLPI